MFYLYSDPTHSNGNYEPLAADSLERLSDMLIEINDRWGTSDLSADYWPELYWNSPDSFSLDDDEKAPDRREPTKNIVLGLARSIWDTGHAYILETGSHTSLTELARFASEKYGITSDGFHNLIDERKRLIEALDGKIIDEASIINEDAMLLLSRISTWVEESILSPRLLDVENALHDYEEAEDLANDKRDLLHSAICNAANEGIPLAEIARYTDLSPSEIVNVLHKYS